MLHNVIATARFVRELKRLAKKYASLKSEYEILINELEQNPEKGTALGNNLYKIRLAIASKGKGKSGGARVITYLKTEEGKVFLLSICAKPPVISSVFMCFHPKLLLYTNSVYFQAIQNIPNHSMYQYIGLCRIYCNVGLTQNNKNHIFLLCEIHSYRQL